MEMVKDDNAMCWAYSLQAIRQATRNNDESATPRYDFDPAKFAKVYGSDRFSQAEYLAYLEQQGFDSDKIKADVLASLELTRETQLGSQQKAVDFFELFKNAWHVLDADVTKYLDGDSIYYLLELAVADASATKARLLAIRRHAEDPKQREKEQVRECWKLWQAEPARYKSKSAFSKDMLSKFESLESQRVIERWCKKWESELF